MTDTVVGRALGNDLVRQIAIRTHDCDGAEDLARSATLKRAHYPARTPVGHTPAGPARAAINANADDAFRAWPDTDPGCAVAVKAVKAIGEYVGTLPANYPSMKSVCNRSRA